MSCQITAVNSCTKKLDFSLIDVDLNPWIEKAAINKQKSVELKGFRKGKAPLSMVEKLYKDTLINDSVMLLVSNQMYAELQKSNIFPVDRPVLTGVDFKQEEKTLNFSVEVSVAPEVVLGDISIFKCPEISVSVQEDEILSSIDNVKKRQAKNVELAPDELPQDGDRISFDLNCLTVGYEANSMVNLKAAEVVLNETAFPWGCTILHPFLKELKVGQKSRSKIKLAGDTIPVDLQGQELEFEMVCHQITRSQSPSDQEMVTNLGYDSLEQLREEIGKNLRKNKWKEGKQKAEKAALDAVIAAHPFDVPDLYIQRQLEHKANQLKKSFSQFGANSKMIDSFISSRSEEMKAEAALEIKRALVLQELIKKTNPMVDDALIADFRAKDPRAAQESDDLLKNFVAEQIVIFQLLGWSFDINLIVEA